jgi:signal transduction histidine kinase
MNSNLATSGESAVVVPSKDAGRAAIKARARGSGGPLDADGSFPLVRYFTMTSLVAFLLVAAALYMEIFHFARGTLVSTQERLSTSFADALANDLFRDRGDRLHRIDDMAGLSQDALLRTEEFEALEADMRRVVAGTAIYKVKIYDRHRRTVYSTEHRQIGEISTSAGVFSALRGVGVSELVHRDTFSGLEGIVMDRDLVQSYIPFSFDTSRGREVWVFEIYSDVTDILRANTRAHWSTAFSVLALLVVLFVVLRVFVKRADQTIGRQVTERELAYKLVREREVALDRDKNEFFAAAAHELRTPMTVIQGFAELLRTRAMQKRDFEDSLDSILSQSNGMLMLLDDILELTSLDDRSAPALRLERQHAGPLVAEALRRISSPDASGRIHLSMEDDLDCAMIDGERLIQSVINLLANALKYSAPENPIDIRISGESRADVRGLAIRVRDRGIGMTPEELKRVFERFWRADTVKLIKGTGLGMSIVKSTMERHGGYVDVESIPGEGTTVTLWLPCCERGGEEKL